MNLIDFSHQQKNSSKIFEKVVEVCQDFLYNNPLAKETKEYLGSRISLDIQIQYQFGWFPDNQNINVLINKVGVEKLQQIKLIYPKILDEQQYHLHQGVLSNHNLIFPYHNLYGDVITLIGRSLNPSKNISKYKNPFFNKSLHLFNLNNAIPYILQENCVILVEGQFDVLSCVSMGIKNIVALCGGNLSRYQLSLLSRFTNNFYLLLDNDEPGRLAEKKILKNYQSYGNFYVLKLPDIIKDVDQYIKEVNFDRTQASQINSLSGEFIRNLQPTGKIDGDIR